MIFGALCRDCPLRARCTTSKTGRTLNLHERDDLLRAARRDWAADPDLRENYRQHRPNVERVISQIASRGGRRPFACSSARFPDFASRSGSRRSPLRRSSPVRLSFPFRELKSPLSIVSQQFKPGPR